MKFFKQLIISVMMIGLMASTSYATQPKDDPGFYKHTETGQVKYFKDGHPSDISQWILLKETSEADVGVYVNPNSEINGALITAPGSDSWAGGQATADVLLSGEGYALGADKWTWGWFGPKFEPGFAEADGNTNLIMSSEVEIRTNGPQFTGLSWTFAKSTSKLIIDGEVWAKGNDGYLQEASLEVSGSLSSLVYGNSLSEGPNGSFASAGGNGMTTVDFRGREYDSSLDGWWIFPNKAFVDFNSKIEVDQSLFTVSYVSEDGMTSSNYARVGGGSAILERGRDGWFAKDNIDLVGIKAEGAVSQSGMATNGAGAYAFGNSSASFSGAEGVILQPAGYSCFKPTIQKADVGGYAKVTGSNKITVTPSSLTVTSTQHGYATTGNTGSIER